jgi:hypothetical protein
MNSCSLKSITYCPASLLNCHNLNQYSASNLIDTRARKANLCFCLPRSFFVHNVSIVHVKYKSGCAIFPSYHTGKLQDSKWKMEYMLPLHCVGSPRSVWSLWLWSAQPELAHRACGLLLQPLINAHRMELQRRIKPTTSIQFNPLKTTK